MTDNDYEKIRTLIRDELKPLRDDIKYLSAIISGDADPSTGLIIRVDRLEGRIKHAQDRANRGALWLRWAIGSAIAAVAAAIASWIR